MKKIMFCLFLFLVIFVSVPGNMSAESAAVFSELKQPEAILVDGGKLLVTDGLHVYIYSATDFKLIKKMGKPGPGVGESLQSPYPHLSSIIVYLEADRIMVTNIVKVLFFSKDGDFQNEVPIPSGLGRFVPVGNKYSSLNIIRENEIRYLELSLYNKKFEKEKQYFKLKAPRQDNQKINPISLFLSNKTFLYYSSTDLLFVPTSEGVLKAFNDKGESVFDIKPGFPKIEVTDDLKKKLDENLSSDERFGMYYSQLKMNDGLANPTHFPIIRDYRIADGKVYLFSNAQEKGKYKTAIYDAKKGSLLEKKSLSLQSLNRLEFYPFAISKGKIYQLIQNKDKNWELHISEI